MKTLERLRQQKGKAVDRMAALNALAKSENRDLNETEKLEFGTRKTEAEGLAETITQLEQELAERAPAPVPPAVNSEALRAEGARLERERLTGIDTAASSFLRRSEIDAAFVAQFKNEGKTVDELKAAIFEKLRARSEENPTNPGQPVVGTGAAVTVDARDKRREGMAAWTLYRGDPGRFATLKDKGGEYRGMRLVDMARECLEAIGMKTRGMDTHEIVRFAMMGPAEGMYHLAGYQSTSDLPNILANISGKSLRQAYEAASPTYRQVAREVSVADFKQNKSVNLSDLAALQKVNEHGEFARTSISDNGEPFQVLTYGEVVAITRQVVINDDLKSLVRIPEALGNAAARMESDVFWAVVTANANMSDGNAIFSAAHSNLITGAGSAMQLTALSAGRSTMRLQTAPKGTILDLVPKIVLVPAVLETPAMQIVNPMQLAPTTPAGVVPQWVTQLTVVAEPRLDKASQTAWYLVAPGDGMIFCFLEGNQGVYTETRMGFDVDGMEIKAREDFGAAVVEFRTWQKNAGA